MKALVKTEFPGRPDNAPLTRTLAVGETIEGDLARVAVAQGWADALDADPQDGLPADPGDGKSPSGKIGSGKNPSGKNPGKMNRTELPALAADEGVTIEEGDTNKVIAAKILAARTAAHTE